MSDQKLIINPNYTRYSDYNADEFPYNENQQLCDSTSRVDTFSLKIRGCVDNDGVDENVTTKIKNKTLEGIYGMNYNYKFTYTVTLKLHLYRKYHGRDCKVTYKYEYNYISVGGRDFIIDITDGKNHPKVLLCGKNALSYKVSNITYVGKGSTLRNFKRNARGVFLPNYVSLRKIKPY
ncbi:Hypothetical protein PACV_438 [Pacmanvirus A23]|uniref:Hypothetical protein n=1 Tax=Pacmanvirus A23 TaxID=1932881 RepID=UPI000A095F87|nr:Hypothetical protein B9W72_gp434 [Pacmanvirus A23]SIP86151.1 Hypothetical protein PACV_438 [Pacmanvirus A23]